MSIWTLAYKGTTKDVDQWGISGLNLSRAPVGMDRLTFSIDVDSADDADVFDYNEFIRLYKNGEQWFVGRVEEPTISESAGQVRQLYSAIGPGKYLVDQPLKLMGIMLLDVDGVPILSQVYQQHLWLGKKVYQVDINGNPNAEQIGIGDGNPAGDYTWKSIEIDNGEVIREVLEWGLTCWRANNPTLPDLYQIGTITPDTKFVPYECKNMKCRGAIDYASRWTDDIIIMVDYKQNPPMFNVRRKGDGLESVTFPLDGSLVDQHSVKRRRDRAVPSVSLLYEISGSIDDKSYWYQSLDRYPVAATGNEEGAFAANISVAGFSSTTLQGQTTCIAIPTMPAIGTAISITEAQYDFWEMFCPALKQRATGKISVQAIQWRGFGDPSAPRLIPVDNLGQHLIDGTVCGWMRDPSNPLIEIVCEDDQATADLHYIFTDENGVQHEKVETITATLKCTNAPVGTQNYFMQSQFDTGDSIPSNLAQKIYTDCNRVDYEGTIVLHEDECGDSFEIQGVEGIVGVGGEEVDGTGTGNIPEGVGGEEIEGVGGEDMEGLDGEAQVSGELYLSNLLGLLVNLSGGRAEWATMDGLIQSVDHDIDNGITTIRFGPNTHLGPDDRMQLQAALQHRWTYNAPSMQASGLSAGGASKPSVGDRVANGGNAGTERSKDIWLNQVWTNPLAAGSSNISINVKDSGGLPQGIIKIEKTPGQTPNSAVFSTADMAGLDMKYRRYVYCEKTMVNGVATYTEWYVYLHGSPLVDPTNSTITKEPGPVV